MTIKQFNLIETENKEDFFQDHNKKMGNLRDIYEQDHEDLKKFYEKKFENFRVKKKIFKTKI